MLANDVVGVLVVGLVEAVGWSLPALALCPLTNEDIMLIAWFAVDIMPEVLADVFALADKFVEVEPTGFVVDEEFALAEAAELAELPEPIPNVVFAALLIVFTALFRAELFAETAELDPTGFVVFEAPPVGLVPF